MPVADDLDLEDQVDEAEDEGGEDYGGGYEEPDNRPSIDSASGQRRSGTQQRSSKKPSANPNAPKTSNNKPAGSAPSSAAAANNSANNLRNTSSSAAAATVSEAGKDIEGIDPILAAKGLQDLTKGDLEGAAKIVADQAAQEATSDIFDGLLIAYIPTFGFSVWVMVFLFFFGKLIGKELTGIQKIITAFLVLVFIIFYMIVLFASIISVCNSPIGFIESTYGKLSAAFGGSYQSICKTFQIH